MREFNAVGVGHTHTHTNIYCNTTRVVVGTNEKLSQCGTYYSNLVTTSCVLVIMHITSSITVSREMKYENLFANPEQFPAVSEEMKVDLLMLTVASTAYLRHIQALPLHILHVISQ